MSYTGLCREVYENIRPVPLTKLDQFGFILKVQPYKKANTLTQQRVDEILDKISQRGYGSLTDDEKDMLRRASQEDMS